MADCEISILIGQNLYAKSEIPVESQVSYSMLFKVLHLFFLVLLLFLGNKAIAASQPFFMALPLGQDVKAIFYQNGKRLYDHNSIEGKLYLPDGLPEGVYSLELQSIQSPEQKKVVEVVVEHTPYGLATVVRPELPWAMVAAQDVEEGEFATPGGESENRTYHQRQGTPRMNAGHILIIMMMSICVLAVLVIMRKKGKLPPLRLPEKLLFRLPDRVVKRLSPRSSVSRSFKASPDTKTVELGVPIAPAALEELEKKLRRGRSFVRIPGETVQRASTWHSEFGNIVLTSLYSRGGVGAVYKGFGSLDPNRQLAIKMPLASIVSKQSNKDIESISAEFENNKRFGLNSRLIRFYELRKMTVHPAAGGEPFPVYYSIMEFFGGTPLKELIQTNSLGFHGKMSVAIELLEALGPVHQQGLTHNDIKPGNVLINYNGGSRSVDAAKLIDFGSATLSTKASVDYASPELLLKKPVSPKSDLFSLGLLFYEMFEGGLPYPSGNGQGGSHITSSKEFDLQFVKLDGHVELQAIIRGMLAKNPTDRPFESTSDVLARLRII